MFWNQGLSYDTNETVLRDAFEQHGEIIEGKNQRSFFFIYFVSPNWLCRNSQPINVFAVKVICDHVTGKSKGYGFVRFTTETAAATGRKDMHGQVILFFYYYYYYYCYYCFFNMNSLVYKMYTCLKKYPRLKIRNLFHLTNS